MMPIWLSIVSATPVEKTSGSDDAARAPPAIQTPSRARPPPAAGIAAGRRSRAVSRRRSCLARPEQALRPEDQDQHQQQVGQDRRDLRDRHVPERRQRDVRCDVTPKRAEQRRRARRRARRRRSGRRPISSEATNAPASEPMPPTTTTTNMIGPSSAGHGRLGDEGRPADHAGQRRPAREPPPNTSMNTRGTLWPSRRPCRDGSAPPG